MDAQQQLADAIATAIVRAVDELLKEKAPGAPISLEAVKKQEEILEIAGAIVKEIAVELAGHGFRREDFLACLRDFCRRADILPIA